MTTKVTLIGDGAVNSNTILNTTITADDIANNAVTADKLQSGGNDNVRAVGTNHIKDGAVTAAKLAPGAAIPSGVIVMWSGTIATIPTGWDLCDGQNNTPDLRERFIVGAGGDNSSVAGTTGYNPGNTGGANSVTLNSTQMPYHNHTASDSGHSHNANWFRGIGQGGASWAVANGSDTRTTETGYAQISVGYAGGDANGVTQAHENRPPYYALAYIMKS